MAYGTDQEELVLSVEWGYVRSRGAPRVVLRLVAAHSTLSTAGSLTSDICRSPLHSSRRCGHAHTATAL